MHRRRAAKAAKKKNTADKQVGRNNREISTLSRKLAKARKALRKAKSLRANRGRDKPRAR